jgi:tRNA (guanine37-N1)-methyltransferase
MTPSGKLLGQELLEESYSKLWEEDAEFAIICGHYEWIDQRIIELYVDHELSIGEYVLTSGELSSQVFIDGIIRFIPGVLGNIRSLEEDSFSKRLDRQKEYPVYTRPQEYEWLCVPEELISGNPKVIENWKKQHLR